MKNRLYREQITEYDCGPTAFVNALSYLFKRNEIPAEVVRRIYEYTMDWPKSGSTSIAAMKMLANWLELYKTKKFSVKCEVIEGKEVSFEKLLSQEDHSSCGILFVKYGQNLWHFITFFFEKDNFAYCFDPYPRPKTKSKYWEWLKPEDFNGCNLKINLDYLNTKRSDKPFRAGKCEDRFFILIKRRSKRKTNNR